MSNKSAPKSPTSREERLKAALKANMGRRKAQARARSQARQAAQTDTHKAGEPPREEE